MKRLTLILAVIMMLDVTSAFGWGAKGHDVVAAIAEQHLTPKAKKKISELLDGKSIVYYSSWMDNIQNSPYWENGYNKTKTWHYANVDKGHTYQTMPKNPDGDVVNGLEMITKEMTENYDNLTDSVKVDVTILAPKTKEAVYYLVEEFNLGIEKDIIDEGLGNEENNFLKSKEKGFDGSDVRVCTADELWNHGIRAGGGDARHAPLAY